MRLTDRDIQILLKVHECGWLSTSQIKRYFFDHATPRAVNKRLQVLTEGKYLYNERISLTNEYFFRLGSQGKQALADQAELDVENIHIPRQLPIQLKHFSTINDLRWHFEQSLERLNGTLDFFFTDRELKGLLGDSKIIPDALLDFKLNQADQMRQFIVALEYDAGTENPQYFGRDKVKKYADEVAGERGIFGTAELRVAVFADTRNRVVQLIRYSMQFLPKGRRFLFVSLEDLDGNTDIGDRIFIDPRSASSNGQVDLCSLIE